MLVFTASSQKSEQRRSGSQNFEGLLLYEILAAENSNSKLCMACNDRMQVKSASVSFCLILCSLSALFSSLFVANIAISQISALSVLVKHLVLFIHLLGMLAVLHVSSHGDIFICSLIYDEQVVVMISTYF